LSINITEIQSHSCGLRLQIQSWRKSKDFVKVLLGQYTSSLAVKSGGRLGHSFLTSSGAGC